VARAPKATRRTGGEEGSARSRMVPEWIDWLTQSKIDQLRQIALVAETMIAQGVSEERFWYLVKYVADARYVTAERLAAMGRVDRSTASRWIHCASAPPVLMQEAILAKIAKEVEALAEQLAAGKQFDTDDATAEQGPVSSEPRDKRNTGKRARRG
jgi:hypothetical protein